MKKKQKQKSRKLKMRFWMRLHAAFTIFLLLFYVTLGTLGGFSVLGNDLKAKYAWAAGATISVFVDGLPGKPIITATKTCASNVSAVHLAWTGSEGATSYAITRDGTPLASGFQTMAYVDNNVIGGTDYAYVVTASGAGGDTVSDPLVVTARDCLIILPDPTLDLISFNEKEYLLGDVLSTTKKTFRITGTTNMPNADIQIKTLPGPVFVSTLQANATGYWEYYLPNELSVGTYDFQITAVDPGDFLRNITKDYTFQIISESTPPVPPAPPPTPAPAPKESGGGKHHGSSKGLTENLIPVSTGNPKHNAGNQNVQPQENPLQSSAEAGRIVVKLENENGRIYRGQDAQFRILLVDRNKLSVISNENLFNLKYEILNKKNSVVFSSQVSERIIGNQLEKTLHVPENLPSGSYKIRVSLFDGANLLSGESSFIFVDMPMLNLGGGITLTYLQLVNYVGWLVIILLLLFLFFGFMFVLEYYFFKEALFTVDERNLSKQGMIPRRKGVSQ